MIFIRLSITWETLPTRATTALGRMGQAAVPTDQNGPTGNQRGSGGADDTALYCIDDDAQAARVSFSDVHEIQRNWYLAFFLRSQ